MAISSFSKFPAGASSSIFLVFDFGIADTRCDEKAFYFPVDHFMVAGNNLYEITEFRDLSFYSLISVYEYPDL